MMDVPGTTESAGHSGCLADLEKIELFGGIMSRKWLLLSGN